MEQHTMTPQDLLAIGEKLKKTNEDTTPFAVVKEEKISVIGDANKTQVKSNDYEIKFRIPKDGLEQIPAGAREVGPYYVFTIKYENVTITPRNDLRIVDAIMKIVPFFNKLKEDGSMESLTNEEILSVYVGAGEEVHLAVYNLVATFLGIDDMMGEYMLPFSVISALNRIIDTHPEIFNEADVFFG